MSEQKPKSFLRKNTCKIQQVLDFTYQGQRILSFYDYDKKQELQDLIDKNNQNNINFCSCCLLSNILIPCEFFIIETRKYNYNNWQIKNIKNFEDIENMDSLKYYGMEGSVYPPTVSSTPKLETIYIQDPKNEQLFISASIYFQYIYEHHIQEEFIHFLPNAFNEEKKKIEDQMKKAVKEFNKLQNMCENFPNNFEKNYKTRFEDLTGNFSQMIKKWMLDNKNILLPTLGRKKCFYLS